MNGPQIRAYLDLTKPRIVSMALVTLAMGFWAASGPTTAWQTLFFALLGAGLVASGASTLNHYIERDADARMERTRARPIPSGSIKPASALTFGIYLILAGLALSLWLVNLLTAFLLLLSAFLYVLVYTPMKRITVLNTPLGAIPGAIPPLAGWTAASDDLGMGGLLLFLILFVWQHPHFFAISWMYRDDYRRAGFRMLSGADATGATTSAWILITATILVPVSLLPSLLGVTSLAYTTGALIAGIGLVLVCIPMWREHTHANAVRVLKASVYYLPVLLVCMIVDAFI